MSQAIEAWRRYSKIEKKSQKETRIYERIMFTIDNEIKLMLSLFYINEF